MSEAEALRQRLAAAANVTAAARESLERGDMVDLSGLEQEVSDICRNLALLPRDAAEGFKPVLIGLADDLDRLTAALSANYKRLAEELSAVSARQRAAKAYGQPQED